MPWRKFVFTNGMHFLTPNEQHKSSQGTYLLAYKIKEIPVRKLSKYITCIKEHSHKLPYLI